jgi:hypothetical protein
MQKNWSSLMQYVDKKNHWSLLQYVDVIFVHYNMLTQMFTL